MLRKYATATIISAEIATTNALGLVKASHRAVFNYEPRPGFLYVRSRMISSRCNDNWDEFPAEEICQGWPTFIGKPVFVNHHNEDHRRMRGVIIDAALHEDTLPSGEPDTWVEGLHEVDAIRFPKLAQAIISGRVNRTSMGTDVAHSECSACGNRATTPAEYCQHIPRMKGKILYRHTASGQREGHLIREKCYGLRFFENSFLVEDPADPTAIITGIDSRQVSPNLSSGHTAYMVRGDVEYVSDHGVRKKATLGQRPDLSNHVIGERSVSVAGSSGAPSFGDHVSRVAGIGTQDPVQRLVAGSNVAGMQNDLSDWDRTDQVDVSPAMGSYTPPLSIRQAEASVTALEGATGPWPAGRGASSAVNLGEVPLHLRHRTDEASISYHGAQRTPADHGVMVSEADRQLGLFPQPKRTPRKKPSKTTTWSSDQPLSYEEIGNRHPSLYGEPEIHGEEAEGSDGWGIGEAANHLAFDRADDPDAEGTSADMLRFHRETVDPKHIDYVRHSTHGPDQRVQNAYEGYKNDPSQVPPLVLVHRHGIYQVADGHHRAEGAAQAGAKVRAYVAYSPHPDEPFSNGDKAPFHGARKTPGLGLHEGMRKRAENTVTCDQGHEHDAPYGAAGMLIRHQGDDGKTRYLLQKRAPWVDHPDTWAFPGGGLHENEGPAQGAVRETQEEMGLLPDGIKPDRLHTDDHGNWAFHTLIADTPHRFEPSGNDGESAGHGWFTEDEMNDLPLHPGFQKSLKVVTSIQVTAAPQYPDPADHPFFKANPAKPEHIVKSFMQANEGQRAQGMRWYSDAHLLAGAIAKGDHAKGAGVLAAYSPKAAWPDNIFNAARSLHEGRALGKGEGASIMGQHQRTAQKIMDGEHHSKVMKSPKIGDFAHLIEHGDDSPDEKEQGKSRVVIDRHALSVAIGRRVTQSDLDDAPLHSRHYYEHVADQYRTAARQISDKLGTPVAPHQVQAVTWGVQQRANEKADAEAAEAHARGRATRTNNSWKRWEEHGKENFPELHSDVPPNLHRRREGANKVHRVQVDEVDSGRRLVNFSEHPEGGNLIREEGKWAAENDYGEPVGENHRDHKRKLRDLADHLGLTGDLDVAYENENTGRKNNFSVPSRTRKTSAKLGFGETKAPQEVDTLRTQSCPVCGEQDSFDGDRCQVCNFMQPPAMFQDPDTSIAQQMDLQKVPFDQGMVGPNGEPVVGPPGDPTALEPQPMGDVPGQPGDQIGDLFCPACGFSADTQEPMTDNDPAMPAQQEGLVEGDVCPNCGEATLLSANDVGEMGGEVPQEIAGDANADGVPDEQEPGVEEGLEQQAEEGALPGEEGPATPDQNDEEAELQDEEADLDKDADDLQTGEQDVDSDQDADDEEPPNALPDAVKRKKAAAKGWKYLPETPMRENMTKPNEAAALDPRIAALQQIVDRQDRLIRVQGEQLKVAGQQLHYLSTVAGVGKEFDAMKREGAKKIADIMNPAQPVPDPADQGPSESTDQAATPETFDDPRRPGLTPGSTNGVPAQMTDSPLTPGVTVPTQPFNDLVDVTAPVNGTETQVPLDQTKIETDVRVGDPMANADNPQGYGFPLTGPFAQDGAASVGTTTSPGAPVGGAAERTMASIRLARLRKDAGLIEGGDDLTEAAKIEATAGLSLGAINVEIATLEGVRKVANRKEAGRRPQGGPLPRQAAGERQAPSLAGAPNNRFVVSASLGDDDASDLFLD
jgi:8-oxo-dGTP pyrophosphatase MutT (NUDIX family)